MPRPGGNPELAKYQFEQRYTWDEPCTAKLSMRVPPSMLEELKSLPNWQELVRQAIAAKLSAIASESEKAEAENA